MTTFSTNKIKLFLSDKKVTVIILALAIGARVMQLIYFYNIRVDASFQVMGTQNLLSGHGISLAKVVPSDISSIIYEPLINWPPGYSLLLTPFYIIFNHNYIAAGLTLDIIAAITLIFITRGILQILNTPLYLINIFTLINGFFIYYFYFIASSDAIAITFFLIALYFTLVLIKNIPSFSGAQDLQDVSSKASSVQREKKIPWVFKTSMIIVCLFICGLIKYLFIPVVFVIPLFLIAKGIADRNAIHKKAGIIMLFTLAISIGAVLLIQKMTSGSATYISSGGRGLFFENLLSAYPFIPASIIKPDSIALLINQPELQTVLFHIFQWMHLVFILFVLIYLVLNLKKFAYERMSVTDSFMLLTCLISLAITLLLTVLSIRVAKEEIMPGILWTYVEEPRYYGLPCVLLHMAIFGISQYYRSNRSRLMKFVLYFLILSLVPEMARGMIFTVHRVQNIGKEEYSWQYENRFQKYADSIIINASKKYSTNKIVVTGTSYYMNHRVILHSHVPPLNEVGIINNLSSLNTTSPVLLFIILHERDLAGFKSFLSNKEKDETGYFEGFHFYTCYITPH